MSVEDHPCLDRPLTCVLARPGRYELIWTATAAAAAPRAGVNIPISRPVVQEILQMLGARRPETGGLLLGPKNNRLVTHFLFDAAGVSDEISLTWDHRGLNQALQPYLACGMDIKGMVHSHPAGCPEPSEGDRQYLLRLLDRSRTNSEEFFFPVHCDGRLQPFVVTADSLRRGQPWALPAQILLV